MERTVLSCTKKVHCWLYSKLWNVHRLFHFYLAIGYHIRNLREIRGRRLWKKVRQWIGPQKWDWHPLEIGSTSLVGCNAPWPARKNSETPALWWPERQHSLIEHNQLTKQEIDCLPRTLLVTWLFSGISSDTSCSILSMNCIHHHKGCKLLAAGHPLQMVYLKQSKSFYI